MHINLAVSNLQEPDFIWQYTPYQSTILEPISRLSAIKDQRCYAKSFMGTIHTARGFECSDSRDRIFGILGLGYGDDRWAAADPDGRSLAEATIPDYSLPVGHVYWQFAIRALQRGLTEDIFLAIQHAGKLEQWQPGAMPSWSPQWDVTLVNNFPFSQRLRMICMFDNFAARDCISFTGSIPERVFASSSSLVATDLLAIDTLNVLSATLDRILALSDSMDLLQLKLPGTILEGFWEEHIRPGEADPGYKAVMTDLCETASYYVTSENPGNAFWPVAQHSVETFPEAIANYATHEKYTLFRSIAQLISKKSEVASVEDPTLRVKEWGEHGYLKRFYITRRGYFGVCPAAVQPGDHVALLWNTDCPMILRPQDDFYRIVGGSYMAALNRKRMEGIPHPLDDLLSGGLQPEMIKIR